VADRVLLSAARRNFEDCIRLAQQQALGIEMMTFAFPDVLDGDWKSLAAQYRVMLRDVPGMLAMHGPFMDMASGSPDKRINQVCIERYEHAIRIAAELNVEMVIFHANFIAAIHTDEYRLSWHSRNIAFWSPMADYARQHGLTIAVENMWEYDPSIIGNVVKEIAHPNLKICLDVGHAHLYGEVPFETWLDELEPILVHTHMNNNNGVIDVHHAFSDGVMNYDKILPQIRGLRMPPSITLEMDEISMMEASLSYLELPTAATPPADA
jgi:sugar phosphate isomerase/epimerase